LYNITLAAVIELEVAVPELQETKQKENAITNTRISDVSLLLFTSCTPPRDALLAALYTRNTTNSIHNWQFTDNRSQNGHRPNLYEELMGFTLITPPDINPKRSLCL